MANLCSERILPLLEVYVDSSIDDHRYEDLQATVENCSGVTITRREDLRDRIHEIIASKIFKVHGTNAGSNLLAAAEIEHHEACCLEYNYVLVFEYGVRTLEDIFQHEPIPPGSCVAKQLLTDIANACQTVHALGCSHGNLHPHHILQVGTTLKLIGLDARQEIEDANDVADDLFSFGLILFRIEALDQNRKTASIVLNRKISLSDKLSVVPSQTARSLLVKLLEPDPELRCHHFSAENKDSNESNGVMKNVLKDPYFDVDVNFVGGNILQDDEEVTHKSESLRLEPKLQKGYQNDSESEGFAIPDCLSCVIS